MRKEPRWLNQKIVLTIHLDQLKQHGGSQGIRDQGLLESALDRPKNKWYNHSSSNIFDLAASLCIGIAKNHPFIDGNKRVAFMATYVFLGINGYNIEVPEEEVVSIMLKVASGNINETNLSIWLKDSSNRNLR
ncbi:type II toxin-antitoxin system death-on-curing family toxin [Leptospira kirschneri]|uniref:Death-on-curing family protein n=1 Tax=Leptospira kirschneri str. 200802841 TaxID=1193047 RepID=A0A828Y3E4_9LEPT|nr:type II toxin-antitoxin system death-on-curing family toxin [Leptospira kirschneri]EKO50788.1 death-on-curing family protein [Leptospira kirschneri str. 200802841]EMN26547.1 death-on-curing family protein [Leptospira kirschneri serovar Sokoine str. RM1]EMO74213.1 death-on-curing family protein [Leptospira kirschneri str. 200801925]EPG48411.1 death-on-curing family protein [Leptospira kirschneri serovar Cynopteri str. 3522 CT]